MPENVVLKHENPDVPPFVVPVPDGITAQDVAAAWAHSGWSLAETAHPDVAGNVVTAPPLNGAGSSGDAWRAYAESFDDVAVAEGASRDDIVAALRAAGHPVESA